MYMYPRTYTKETHNLLDLQKQKQQHGNQSIMPLFSWNKLPGSKEDVENTSGAAAARII